jgi:lipopolysaccharide export system protein LptA
MPLKVYRLRRLLAATAILLTVVVTGMYFYARMKATNVLNQIPGKIGYDIKQTATGFQFSKSDGKRTLFTIQASNLKQFKLDGLAELHNVSIVLYGRDSSRYDQIYGDDFSYDQKSGNVIAKGEVQIDLLANPAGLASPDQSAPKELKDPIHLKTRDLVFNRETGNAATNARVEFRTPQASGSAVGVGYAGKANILTLSSQVHVVLTGANAAVIDAEHGIITNDPRQIVLDHPRLSRKGGILTADSAVFYLGPDNSVESVLASGNVNSETHTAPSKSMANRTDSSARVQAKDQASDIHVRSDQAEFLLTGKHDLLRTATLTGNVHLDQQGPQPMQGDAGRVILDFAGQNKLQKVHALDGAHIVQKASTESTKSKPATKGTTSGPQDFELTAPVIDFTVAQGRLLRHAVTSGAAQITISQAQGITALAPAGQRTVVTAGKFEADFTSSQGKSRLTKIHGTPNARIVSSTPGQPDRVSTSESVDAKFLPQGGIEAVTQQGNVAYSDQQSPEKRTQASAESARYTPADQMLVLSGSPRVTNGGMATTAKVVRINRATGDDVAEGNVKTTYSELKEQPDGALLASSSPIHVTASSMTARASGVALYTGNARLWQDANIIEAPSIQFDRDDRFVTAQGTAGHPVQTILVQKEKAQKNITSGGKKRIKDESASSKQDAASDSSPISLIAARLTYADSERRVHYEGGVSAKGPEFTASANVADAYLVAHSQTSSNQSFAGPGQLDHMVAQGDVVVQQPNRRASGQNLVYTAADDKFVLTGGPPSIFDAEQGKITGVSLTFFRRDDRVLVEGEASTPVVTQTRVAR